MKKLAYLFLLSVSFSHFYTKTQAQCSVEAFPSDTIEIICGQTELISLNAFGNSGNQPLNNDFNDGTAGAGWQATAAATYTNPCEDSPDNTTYLWMGDATPQPRIMTTQSFDLTPGGTICFEMRFAVQAENAPCEGPDEPQEGVYLQYSIDNGANWVTINYFDPIGGYDATLTSWHLYCFDIPVAAQTANAQIRWFQDATSGAQYDHWGLDNVAITLNDPSYYYYWSHNGFVGPTPPIATATTDSIYTVYYTNGVDDTCSSAVIVHQLPPVFSLSSVSDTSLCGAGCIDLNATANIVIRPASQPTFENNESQDLTPSILGIPGITEIPINVGGVGLPTISGGSILSVCLNLTAFPDATSIKVELKCPGGAAVTLVPIGSLTGNSLSNTCFTPGATTSITSGTPPYSGNYSPFPGSLNDFIGCSPNGIWTMTISNTALVAFGTFNSWGITFDIPEISYQGIYEWTPTTGLSDPFSLNPTACPTTTTTYTLAVRDSNNCATSTHDVTIATTPFDVTDATTVNPTQGESNGEITVISEGGLAPFHYSLNNGLTSQDSSHITGLPAGTYPILVTDAGNCSDTITVVLEDFVPIQIPNIINPHSQEVDNKTFVIKGMDEPEVTIYNRWGNKIYQTDAYKNDWDGGKYHDGTFYYLAKDKADGKTYHGFFQLVRF